MFRKVATIIGEYLRLDRQHAGEIGSHDLHQNTCSFQYVEQIFAVAALGQRLRQPFQLRRIDETLAIGHFLGAADFGQAPGGVRWFVQLRRSATSHGCRCQPAMPRPMISTLKCHRPVQAVEVGYFQLAACEERGCARSTTLLS